MTKDINDIIGIIERNSETYSSPVYIPSLKEEASFREISTAQHKRILKSSIDDPFYNSLFIKTMYSIIKENCTSDIDVDKLTMLDKLLIMLHMRSVSIGDEIKIEMESKKNKGQTYKTSFKISDILKKAKKAVKDIEPKVLEIEQYKIYCNVPNILTEYNIEKELRNDEIKDIESAEDLRESFAEKFINEVCKYVSKIDIVKEEETVEVNFEEYSFADRIKILEKLPSKVAEKIVEYMGDVNTEIEKISILDKKVTIDGQKEEFTYQLSLDATFFTSFSD
jgi:hypothetical protein